MDLSNYKKPKLRYTTMDGEPIAPGEFRKMKDPKRVEEAADRLLNMKKHSLGDTTIEEMLREIRGNFYD